MTVKLFKKGALYGYYINLDERGDFFADVRNQNGRSIFEIRAGNSLKEDESSIFEDGFMRDKGDLSGLTTYLIDLGFIPKESQVLACEDFEARIHELANPPNPTPRMRP